MTVPPTLFDQRLRRLRRARAYRTGHRGADFLLRATADDLVQRLAAVDRRFDRAIDIGSATSDLATRLTASSQVGRVIRLDRIPESGPDIVASEEALPLSAGSFDLAVSALALQWSDDLPGALVQIRRALKADGLLLATIAGGDTLIELREALTAAEVDVTGGASPRIAPFAELSDLGTLLQRAGFALPVVDREKLTVRYDTARALMHDLRAMGATNTLVQRNPRILPRAVFDRCEEIYRGQFADPDGRIRATFDLFSLTAWSPHESQQQPLRPGSAVSRLADALGTDERSAGEKTGR